jgi:hypothetical protein
MTLDEHLECRYVATLKPPYELFVAVLPQATSSLVRSRLVARPARRGAIARAGLSRYYPCSGIQGQR